MYNIETYEQLKDVINEYIKDEQELKLIDESYKFAKKAHENVKRLSGEDYITHPINTAYILTSLKVNSTILSAALLHDTLKNENIKIEDIKEIFGQDIASIVDNVNKITKLTFKLESKDDINKQRKILVGLSEDVRVIMIKLAERLHNMRTIESQEEAKRKEKAIETLEVYAPIAHGIGMGKIKSELEDISLKYANKEGYRSVVDKLDETKEERDKYIDTMIKEVSNLLNENNIEHKIKGRSKGIYSIFKKLDKGRRFEDIYDILALRIFVNTVSECYQVMGIIHSKYKPIPKRIKDFIAMPKANMYQSLHTTVYGINDELFEIQIRTYEMDEIAERGIASHWSYKENNSSKNKSDLEKQLQFFRSIIELNQEESNDETFVNAVKNEIFNNAIYVYTPDGKVIELKEGSTPIDFAYRIHSDIGDKMVGATVNGSIVPLDYVLHDNDIVKIKTNKNQLGPSYEWLNIAKTNTAKSKIRAYFNRLDKEETLKKGEELLQKELRKRKIAINEFLIDENIDKIIKELHLKNIEDMYMQIGSSNITIGSIINIIYENNDSKEESIIKKATNGEEALVTIVKNDILVAGFNEIKVNVASCCKPVPGDEIIGYITKGYGINVHKKDCNNLLSKKERLISAKWNVDTKEKYPTCIKVTTLKNTNSLISIVSKSGNNNVSIKTINTHELTDYTTYDITLLVDSKEKLFKFMNDLKNINDVINVERIFL